jgi:hypothetical protein
MVVAVITMRMVQVPIDEVVDVVPVGNRFMATTGPMEVIFGMATASMLGCAIGRVNHVDGEVMLHDAFGRVVVQVAIVEIIHMIAMLNRGVAAVRAVLMVVVVMGMASHERISPCNIGCCYSISAARSFATRNSSTCPTHTSEKHCGQSQYCGRFRDRHIIEENSTVHIRE